MAPLFERAQVPQAHPKQVSVTVRDEEAGPGYTITQFRSTSNPATKEGTLHDRET